MPHTGLPGIDELRNMNLNEVSKEELLCLIEELTARYEDADATVQAIRAGAVDAVVVSGRDGERVFTLQGADHVYRAAVEMMNEGVVTLTPSGTILFCNAKFASLIKTPLEQIVGMEFTPLACRADRHSLGKFIADSTSRAGRITLALTAADGTEVPATLSSVTISLEEMPIVCIVVTDLSELFAAEQTRRRLASIVEGSNDAIISTSTDGHVMSWNAAAEHIYGYTEREIRGKHVSIIVPEDRANETQWFLETIRTGNRIKDYETVRLAKGAKPVQVSISIAPLQDARGQTVGISAIMRDISERKKAEAELEKYQEHLEDLVAQRTAELKKEVEERKRTEDELARSNTDLEQFAYVASHDLQEPLRQITGFTQLLADRYRTKLDPAADEFITYIVEGSQRMQALIKDLLVYSRVGKTGHVKEPADIGLIFQQALANLKATITDAQAEITADTMPALNVVPSQIMQVFQNLLANALKFRSQEPPRIHVAAQHKQDHWLFSVKDNGIGFDEQFAPRAFELFQRLHNQQGRPGTGIGLPICKRVIEFHGGRIWAESKPGQGATFHFTLPS